MVALGKEYRQELYNQISANVHDELQYSEMQADERIAACHAGSGLASQDAGALQTDIVAL